MIRSTFNINYYWKVIVYFNIDYNFFNVIANTLRRYNVSERDIKLIYDNMNNHKAKAVTISSLNYKVSIVLFNYHKSYYDYINSIIHESEHIKQSILEVYNVDDYGEPPAYTVGHIATQMIKLLNFKIY